MRKADRLFQLTNLIRARQPITAKKIALELNVSIRTVYRYIDDLSVSGIPIYGTTGIGYQLDADFELPPLNLTEKELEALLLGVKMVNSWTGHKTAQAAALLATKIAAVVPKKQLNNYSEIVFAPDFIHLEKKQLWETIHVAIKKRSILTIQYLSLDNITTNRTIYPLGLVYWGGKWTVATWCEKRKDFRSFRLDRIEKITNRQEHFDLTNKINLKVYLKRSKTSSKQ